MHPCTLEPSANDGFATGLSDTETHGKSLGTEVRVLHPLMTALDILGALTHLLTLGSPRRQDVKKVLQTSLDQGSQPASAHY